ncbi:hypothetical protein CJF30_00010732 [Rutstroemia sp. NJR-2017a BBW]|nr:hypothetical protein CJF30_00010732 [Rutstroemia sp. NJR-2017a BBW]
MHTLNISTSFEPSPLSTVESSPTSINTASTTASEKSPISSTATPLPSSPGTRRPRRKTIRRILNRLRSSSDSSQIPSNSPTSSNDKNAVESHERRTGSESLEKTCDRLSNGTKEPIDFAAIHIPLPETVSSRCGPTTAPDPTVECGDSGYYSFTATLSLDLTLSLPPQTVAIIKRLNRCTQFLEYQEMLTTRFSTNLAFLFGKKEVAVVKTRKLDDDTKELLIITLTKLRELVGKTMVHKMILCRRSRGVVREVIEDLVGMERERRDSGVETSTPADDTTVQSSTNPETEIQVQEPRLKQGLHVLRTDLAMQKRLDQVLRAGILGSCGDERLMMGLPSRSERLCLRRFVGFVEGRVGELGVAYSRVERVVGGLEKMELRE